jgi:uncharacterized protein
MGGNKVTMNAQEKLTVLKDDLKQRQRIAIAFSGGVDSTFLLKVAHDLLGDNVIAVTATSCSFPKRELKEASDFCKEEGIRHIICESEELQIDGFSHNPVNRCYLCKTELFTKIWNIAKQQDIPFVAEASNIDDNGDYRPGLQAVKELKVLSPLRAADLNKNEIRILSKELGLSTWNKQSFACLSSRFVYGEEITEEKLHMVDEAEQLLLDLGFRQVRVRMHDRIARIEITKEEFPKMLDVLDAQPVTEVIHQRLKKLGFSYVTMDLGGYRTGSMNDSILQN